MNNKKKKNDQQNSGGGVVGAMRNQYQRQRRRSRNLIIAIAGGLALIIAITTVIGLIFTAVESSNVRQIYGETLAAMCRDLPMSQPDMANLPPSDDTTKLLLLRAGASTRHAWHGELPISWRAEDEASVGLVGCVLVDEVQVDRCAYPRPGTEGGTFNVHIERYQTTTTVNLINPTTGERVAERVLVGGEPDACPPDSEDLDVSQRLKGSQPTAADFSDWFESFVDGTAGS